MRFRITHLLIAAVVVAVFAIAFANASLIWFSFIVLGCFAVFSSLICWAVARPHTRSALVPALIVSAACYGLVTLEAGVFWMEFAEEEPIYIYKASVAKFALSVVVGFIAAALSSWFSKTDMKASG